MGREWYQWGPRSTKNRPKSSGRANPEMVAAAAAASGCMGLVSHLFDFHHLHQTNPDHHHPFNSSSVKGPRNSLETTTASSAEAEQDEDDNLCIPTGIHVNTGRRDTVLLRSQSTDYKAETSATPLSSSRRDTKLLRIRAPRPKAGDEQGSFSSTNNDIISISPAGARTPNVVARLMGLDLIPESYTQTSSNAAHISHSPRYEGGRRSDADSYSYNNRRLSLQINKENRCLVELSRHSCSEINTKRDLGLEDESMISRSPSYYARQIIKQVKESVMRRRFGADITNKTGDFNPFFTKGKTPQPLLDQPPVANMKPEERQVQPSKMRTPSEGRALSRMNRKEEQFVRATTKPSHVSDKKTKTTPLSSELLLPFNRKPLQGPKKKAKQVSHPAPTPPARTDIRSEFNYVSQVLKRAGIINGDTLSSHPLDPSIFQLMEEADNEELSPKCNRRLMFDLVDEILTHIMRPPKLGWAQLHGFQVTRMVWSMVKDFPRAHCTILQDIDELVQMDLSGFAAGDVEQDDVVAQIEREIVQALLADTTQLLGAHITANLSPSHI